MRRPDLEVLQQLARRDDWHLSLVGSNIREVIAFPKSQSGTDPMTNAPTIPNPKQLAELGIRAMPPKA